MSGGIHKKTLSEEDIPFEEQLQRTPYDFKLWWKYIQIKIRMYNNNNNNHKQRDHKRTKSSSKRSTITRTSTFRNFTKYRDSTRTMMQVLNDLDNVADASSDAIVRTESSSSSSNKLNQSYHIL